MIREAKIFVKTLAFFVVTTGHCMINMFGRKKRISKEILLIKGDIYDHTLSPIEDKLDAYKIVSHNIFSNNTFFLRINDNKQVSFNQIIRRPYTGICITEESMNNNLTRFYANNMYRFLKNSNIRKMVLQDEYSVPGRSYVRACSKIKGCKSIALQHGLLTENCTHNYIFPSSQKGIIPLPDYLLCYGEYERQLLTNKSIWNKEQVVPLGSPRYDNLFDYKCDKARLRKELGIPEGLKIIFWPTQTHDVIMSENNENDLNADCVFHTISNLKNYYLIIKMHPNENVNKSLNFYNRYKKKYSLERCIILTHNQADTYDCIALSDCVILKHTTVGKESILMNKPIINFAFIEGPYLNEYKMLKSSLLIKNKEDLTKHLRTIETKEYAKLFMSERNKYLNYHFANFGVSTRKVTDFIQSL